MTAWNNAYQLVLRKKFGDPNLGPTGQNQAQNEVFHHFLEFGLQDFLEIAYDDSLTMSNI